jgi:hypothetical protein
MDGRGNPTTNANATIYDTKADSKVPNVSDDVVDDKTLEGILKLFYVHLYDQRDALMSEHFLLESHGCHHGTPLLENLHHQNLHHEIHHHHEASVFSPPRTA